MPPRDIVVFIEEDAERDGRLAWAAALAARWRACLIGCFAAPGMFVDHHAAFAVGAGCEGVVTTYNAGVRKAAAAARMVLERTAAGHGIACEFRVAEEAQGEALMLHARHASLSVVGARRRAGEETVTALSLSEDVIFASGLPTVLLPADWPPSRLPGRVMIGWNGSREAARAIADAMPFLQEAAAVDLVVVSDRRIAHLLGQEPGADMARHLARNGISVAVHQLDGDAGTALLDHARLAGADLLVMGAHTRSRVSELMFGGATRSILTRATLPILLSR